MSSTKSSRKRTEKVSSDSADLSFDLLSNLTYMSALASADIPRDTLFRYTAAQPFKTSLYFKQIYLLTKRLGFEYSQSFRLAAEKAGAPVRKSGNVGIARMVTGFPRSGLSI